MSEPKRGRLVHEIEDGTVRQSVDAVAANAVRVDDEDARRMVTALNTAHAGAFNLLYLVRKHYWSVEGAESGDVAEFY